MRPYYEVDNFTLYHGDCIQILKDLKIKPVLVFADPPYFLSNDGYCIQSGEIVSVNKGEWDKLRNNQTINDFNFNWLNSIREIMPAEGTLWISGTFHNIFSIAQQLSELNFRILNSIVWHKTNPPPNFSKRFFTHSSEIIIWARKEPKTPHYFNYELMKKLNENKQMHDVWRLPAISPWEKKQGKHPTQKPLSILCRIILAASKKGDLILDPFAGSSTTGIAANLLSRKYIGIDTEMQFLDISVKRKRELDSIGNSSYLKRITSLNSL
jgi:site-specific DNA-methyltransferase (adenine-specific)